MRSIWKYDGDRLTRADGASAVDHTHDAGPPHKCAGVVITDELLEQARHEVLNLRTRIAQPGHLNNSALPDVQPGAAGQLEQIQTGGGDVLPQRPGLHSESAGPQPVEEFLVHEMNLAQIGLARVNTHPGPVLDGDAEVCVTDNAQARQQFNFTDCVLAELVACRQVDS